LTDDRIHVQIKYKDAEQTFEGTLEETWLLLSKFYSKFIPTFEVARALMLNLDVQALARDCDGLIAFSSEGANVLVSKTKLTDNETLALWLLACYLGKQLNLLECDAMSKDYLQAKLAKSGKITSTRLGELIKSDWIIKTADEKFRMTPFGVSQMQKEVLPRIIAKTGI
jgi:hypothetical protein